MSEPNLLPDMFWDIIEQSHGSRLELSNLLANLSKGDLRNFRDELELALSFLAASDQGLALRNEHRLSDQVIDNIFDSVILRGRSYFTDALDNPELIPHEDQAASSLQGIVLSVYRDRYGEEMEAVKQEEPATSSVGNVVSIIIPTATERPSEEDINRQSEVLEGLKVAGFGDRLVSTGTRPGAVTLTYVIDDLAHFQTVSEFLVSRSFPGRSMVVEQ